ncbi:GNAT family N-acetyltransferase [Saccharothrix violaceirubra]|uniref:RimJ/RimL family protein N-acetyltransferase n=1 Tax=Saccharothrix violaceirubra TaxID=413306 RepID=A0A7W7WYX9_9PSEU|nr:GNAT family N-acetyltransferase [Saccharothrix violaceirubra]MBB4968446.1 RimJ/RimL family protein N-acetyltransferase [Saccharothrix violaceirubra]
MFLETPRLVLRAIEPSDVDDVARLLAEPDVMRYIDTGRPVPRDEVEREVMPKVVGGVGWWAGIEKSSGAFVGWFELSPVAEGVRELGYRLHPSSWGRGYATEGATALVAKGFADLGVHRVVATAMAVNTGSRRVLEKAGLVYVRTFHEDWPDPIPGAEHGDVEYALSR